METTDLEFEFFLAEKLHMSVQRLRKEMPAMEFMQWQVYFGRKAQRMEMESSRGRQ